MAVSSYLEEVKNTPIDVNGGAACAGNEAKGAVQPSSATQKVLDVVSDVSDTAQDWTYTAVDKTNDGIAAVGQQMSALGGTVRNAAPQDGVIGSAASTVADQLQAGGRYLEGHGLQDMGNDLTDVVRHYPLQSVLVGFGLGFMVGMMLKRS